MENTLNFPKQLLIFTAICSSIPTVLSTALPLQYLQPSQNSISAALQNATSDVQALSSTFNLVPETDWGAQLPEPECLNLTVHAVAKMASYKIHGEPKSAIAFSSPNLSIRLSAVHDMDNNLMALTWAIREALSNMVVANEFKARSYFIRRQWNHRTIGILEIGPRVASVQDSTSQENTTATPNNTSSPTTTTSTSATLSSPDRVFSFTFAHEDLGINPRALALALASIMCQFGNSKWDQIIKAPIHTASIAQSDSAAIDITASSTKPWETKPWLKYSDVIWFMLQVWDYMGKEGKYLNGHGLISIDGKNVATVTVWQLFGVLGNTVEGVDVS